MMNCEGTYLLHNIQSDEIQYKYTNSSSLPKPPPEFPIHFVLLDHEYSGHLHAKMVINPISEPVHKSILIKPDDPNPWALAESTLAYLGLESDFHHYVLRDLHDHINLILDEYDKDDDGVVWTSVDVYVVIKRFVKTKMSEKEVEILVNDNCVICLDKLKKISEDDGDEDGDGDWSPTLMPCNHLFHKKCIVEWYFVRDSCPLCRSDSGISFLKWLNDVYFEASQE